MTEQKYRLTVNTLKYEEPWVFDGTLEDIISQLERVHGDVPDPLLWAEKVANLHKCRECDNLTWGTLWWYWAERVHEHDAYRGYRPAPTPLTVREFAYHVLNNEMLGIKKWKHLISIEPLPGEED